MIQLKDKDYFEQRKAIREYDGPLNDEIKRMQNSNKSYFINFIKCIDLMRTVFSETQIEEYIDKTIKEGHSAFEIIRNDKKEIIGLNELDVVTIHPIINSTSEKGWTQYVDSKTIKSFNHDDILYMSMPKTFYDIVKILN